MRRNSILGSGVTNVHNADVHNFVINDYIHRHTAVNTVLTAQANPGDTSLTVNDITGFVQSDLIHFGILNSTSEPIHPTISIPPAASIITLDRPIDNVHPIGTLITEAIADMSTLAGTLAAPISYKYFPGANRIEHIKQIQISMTHTATGADDLFGSEPALTNGMVLRAQINGVLGTFTNWKTNGDIKLDVGPERLINAAKSGPSNFGTAARGTFVDIDVAIPLNNANGDFIEILIQDGASILALADLRIKAQGHVEGF